MNLTRVSLSNPVAVIAAVLLLILFGSIGLFRLPIQLIPNVERPMIQINTGWRAAAPEEIESEIVEPQEDALRGLPGTRKIESSASRGSGSITITFEVDVVLERALIEVMNRLNRVPNYPADVTEPTIFVGRGSFGSPAAWFAIKPLPDRQDVDVNAQLDFAEDVIQTRMERVPGVSSAPIFGGLPTEVRISFDPHAAASLGIEIPTLAALVGGSNDTSAGFGDVGRRRYTVRYEGKYDLRDFQDMVLAWRDGSPVRLRDIATVSIELVDRVGVLSQNGGPSMAFNIQPDQNVNVLALMERVREAVKELNDGPVGRAGLHIRQVYDESHYIVDSISMLRTNLFIGIAFATIILWWFVRRLRATLLVALAIPISLFVAFGALYATGRTLNIISLAGLAFSIGMVLDAAIVVLENIVRLREGGAASEVAAEQGATQVWGALVASTATTVAIFLPIIFLSDVSGQLFADLAFTLALAVTVSLFIAVTVIPTAATTWLRNIELVDPHSAWWERGTNTIMRLTATPARRTAWIVGLLVASVGLSLALLPKADYLPTGKQKFVFGFLSPPPGQSVDVSEAELTGVIDGRMMEHLTGDAEPKIDMYFLGIFGRNGFLGARVSDPCRPTDEQGNQIGGGFGRSLCQIMQVFRPDPVDQFLQKMNGSILQGFPDTFGFATRPSVFGRFGGGRGIELNIQSRDLDAMYAGAQVGFNAAMGAFVDADGRPTAQVNPTPGLELAEPELSLIPVDRRIAEAGWDRRTMARVIQAVGSGLFVGDYFDGDRRRDTILRSRQWTSPDDLAATPVATPARGVMPLGELVTIERTVGPDQIRRVDRRRTVTLDITPPENLSLQEAIETLQNEVEPAIRAVLPEDSEISYFGSADNLRVALANIQFSLALAIAILYLLVSALFRSFRDGFLIILVLALAVVGGVLGLRATDAVLRLGGGSQGMDLLTMIGFITLLGLVVNNAILLVHQTRQTERDGTPRDEAVRHAVRIRLRPILMSTLTSLFGMLPLLLIPGPGTEIYRGLAAVIVGGLGLSTVFTLVLLPSLLRATLLDDALAAMAARLPGRRITAAPGGAGSGYASKHPDD